MFAHPFEDSLESHGVVGLAQEFSASFDDQGVEIEQIAEEVREQRVKGREDLEELECKKADTRLFVSEMWKKMTLCAFGRLAQQKPDIAIGSFLFLGIEIAVCVEVAEFEIPGIMVKKRVRKALRRHIAQDQDGLTMESVAG